MNYDDALEGVRNTPYTLQTLEEYPSNRLPLGLEVIVTQQDDKSDKQTHIERSVIFSGLSRDDIKYIRNEKYAQNHPMKWLARVLGTTIERIGNDPVRAEYKHFSGKKIPEVLLSLPLQDAYYALLMGHIHSFGNTIEKIQGQCPECSKKQSFDVDLSVIQVEYTEENLHKIEVLLEDGLEIKINNPGGDQQESPKFMKLYMRPPELKDAVKHEAYYRSNDQGPFTERIYADCLYSIEAEDGTVYDKAQLTMYGSAIFANMSAKDSAIMEGTLNNLPAMLTFVVEECKNCSADLPVFIQNSFLYPKSRLV